MEQGHQSSDDDLKEARDYAWNHFDRHAQQRQTVFNFYLIIIGASIAAYASTLSISQHASHQFHSLLGAIVALASFVFWRLDQRNARLIKLSEGALIHLEKRLSDRLNDESIRLVSLSEITSSKFPLSYFETFGQIYRFIFVIAGCSGLAVAINSLCLWGAVRTGVPCSW